MHALIDRSYLRWFRLIVLLSRRPGSLEAPTGLGIARPKWGLGRRNQRSHWKHAERLQPDGDGTGNGEWMRVEDRHTQYVYLCFHAAKRTGIPHWEPRAIGFMCIPACRG